MATFQAQVEGITGLSIGTSPTTAELTQFLVDGVNDVSNKVIKLRPQDIQNFQRESATIDSNSGLDVGGAKIISVIREAGADGSSDGSTAWRECKPISAAFQSRVVDPESLYFASQYNPKYMIDDNGKVNVYPVASANNGYKVFFVNNVPTDETNETSLAYGDDDIKWFPNDKVYLVVLYAAIQSLMAKMASLNSALPSDITLPVLPVAPSMNATTVSIPSFTAPDAFVQPVAPAGADIDFSDVPTAPTYVPVSLTLGTTPTISDLSISAVAPVAPSAPSFSTPTISAITIGTMPDIATTILSNVGTPPTYTKPTVTGDGDELTDVSVLDTDNTIDVLADQIEFDQWWSTAAHLIEGEEDTELASAQLQKIQVYIGAYQAEVQNQLNVFNDANAEYQAKLQEGIQQAQINAQRATQQAQIDASKVTTQAQLDATDAQQETTLLLQKENQEYAASLQKFSAEVQEYQANVAKEVQEYQQNLAGDIQVWQGERTTDIQKYGSDIQNETARVGNGMQIYQQEITKAAQKYQAETGYDLGKYSAEVQSSTAKFTNDLQKNNTTFQSDLAKFSTDLKETQQENQEKLAIYNADVQKYNAELTGITQEFTTSLQKDQADYQWLGQQYAALKGKYDETFAVMAPPAPPQQARR